MIGQKIWEAVRNRNQSGSCKLKFITQKELLEKAICTFPYEREFYSAYLDECAEEKLPLGFAKLMRMFDVQDERVSDVEAKEKEEK